MPSAVKNAASNLSRGLFNHIVNSVSQGNSLLLRLRIHHTRNPTPLSMRTNNSSPDGFLELLQPKSVDTDVGKTHWEDIPSVNGVHEIEFP